MSNFFSNFNVVIAKPEDLVDPTSDVLANHQGFFAKKVFTWIS